MSKVTAVIAVSAPETDENPDALVVLTARMDEAEARYRRSERRFRVLSGILLAALVAVVSLPFAVPAAAQGFANTLKQLADKIAALETKTASMSVLTDPKTAQPTVRFSGVNVQVVNNGVGGRGNVIVGYNENDFGDGEGPINSPRTGSHNLIVGNFNSYTGNGGFVAGYLNEINGDYAVVSGGKQNIAAGLYSSVSGGGYNYASGDYSSVSGGNFNAASGLASAVSGGTNNQASSQFSAVSGGSLNIASGDSSSVSGGILNVANNQYATVSGGRSNTASGSAAAISGGFLNAASGTVSSISGGSGNAAAGDRSSISGGGNGSAAGIQSSISGGAFTFVGNTNSWGVSVNSTGSPTQFIGRAFSLPAN